MTLYLLPNLLDPSQPHELALPPAVAVAVRSLQGLIAESEKEGRRYLRKFLSHDEMAKLPIQLLNEHTKELPPLIAPLLQGEKWGLISDAGLPCIADPGADLVYLARGKGIAIETFAGPSSILYAIQLSGLGGQRFAFHGYLPREVPDLERTVREIEKRSAQEGASQVFIEAPYRTAKLFDLLLATLRPETRLCVAASLASPQEKVISKPIASWRQEKVEFGKEPAVFVLLASR